MAPITPHSNDSNHQALMDSLDIQHVSKSFRNANFKPGRRNKNLKQIVSEAYRKEAASVMATQNNSGATTPLPPSFTAAESGDIDTPMTGTDTPSILKASSGATLNLPHADSKLTATTATGTGTQKGGTTTGVAGGLGPTVTYTNIESAPSLHASSHRKYCDITGLPAPYTDSKSRLRYCNAEMFGVVRTLGQHPTEAYLAARGAHTVLK